MPHSFQATMTDRIESISQPKYKIKVHRRVRVRVWDGVEIAAVIVRPEAPERFPAIMAYNLLRWPLVYCQQLVIKELVITIRKNLIRLFKIDEHR